MFFRVLVECKWIQAPIITMIRAFIFFVIHVLILFSCTRPNKTGLLERLPGTPVHLNLLDSTGNDLGMILHPEAFIALQVPGKRTIAKTGQVLVYKNRFICADKKFSSLLMFDSLGLFVKEIGKLGTGPGKYLSIDDLFIDSSANRLFVFSNDSKALVWFGLNDSSNGSVPLGFNGWRCVPVENKYYAFYLNFLGLMNNNHNFFLTNLQGEILKEDLPYSPDIKMGYELSGTITASGPGYFIAPAFGDTLYYATSRNIQPAYVFDLGKRQMPPESLLSSQTLFQYAKECAYVGADILDLPGYLFFDYTEQLAVKYAVYDKKNRQLYTADGVRKTLPGILYRNPVGKTNDGKIISVLHPADIAYCIEHHPGFMLEVKKEYPALYNILNDPGNARNPILIIYSLNT